MTPAKKPAVDILETYVMRPPSAQNVVDLFQGEWCSKLPPELGAEAVPGFADLFNDGRILLAERCLGGLQGRRVLELGPLEGAHSSMLQRLGAREVVAIEASSRAFLKCLCVKELLGLDRVRYHLGDFVAFMRNDTSRFDLVVASGVLYHMANPLEVLSLIAARTDNVLLWTHYYDADRIGRSPDLRRKFGPPERGTHRGVEAAWARQSYQEALDNATFCGGGQETSVWLTRDTLLRVLAAEGFSHTCIEFDTPDHPNGPALALHASRTPLHPA
jgi:SAM-dependent methyltransferase